MIIGVLDHNFKDEIAAEPGGENIKRCFSCGTCTAGCPVCETTDRYNPRKIIRMALLGMRKQVLANDLIWLCAACYTCHERCPQDVRIPELMTAIKNIAVREGRTPVAFITPIDRLKEHGRLYEIGEFENQKRTVLSLPEIKACTRETQRLFSSMQTDRLVAPRK